MLAIGMGSVHSSLGVFNLSREALTGAARAQAGHALRAAGDASSIAGILGLAAEERHLLILLMRGETTGGRPPALDEMAARTGWDRATAAARLQALEEKGLVQALGAGVYRPRLQVRRRSSPLLPSLRGVLDRRSGPFSNDQEGWRARWRAGWRALRSGPGPIAWLSTVPMLALFALAEAMQVAGLGSFAHALGFMGALLTPLLAGIFPVLLLVVSRRKGLATGSAIRRPFDHPLVLGTIGLLSLLSLVLHGTVIWDDWTSRILAFSIAACVVGATVKVLFGHGLARAVVLEWRAQSEDDAASCQLCFGGKPLQSTLALAYRDRAERLEGAFGTVPGADALRRVTIEAPTPGARELRVAVHRLTTEDQLQTVPWTASDPRGSGHAGQ